MSQLVAVYLLPQKSTTIIRSQAALLWEYFCDRWTAAKLPYLPTNEHKEYDPSMLARYFPIPADSGVLTYATVNVLRRSFLFGWHSYIERKDRVNQHRINCGKKPKIVKFKPHREFGDDYCVPFLPPHWYRRKYDGALKLTTRDESCYAVIPFTSLAWENLERQGILDRVSVGIRYAYLHISQEVLCG